MANIKISELDELQEVADQDLFVIVDSDENTTKKIQAGNLNIKGGDTLPIGAVVEYNGTTVPQGYEKVSDNNIIESGSNANGNWIKFVDGTMICNCSVTRNIANNISWNNMYIGDIQNIPFPQQFIELYSCNVDLYSTRNAWKMSAGIPTVSGTGSMFSVSPESFTEDMRIFVIAIGKWK